MASQSARPEREIFDSPSSGCFGKYRNKLAIAFTAGLSAMSCQENEPQEGERTASASVTSARSVAPNITGISASDVNVCDKYIKTDPNIAKYPRASRQGIQRILEKFQGAETAIGNFPGNGCRETIIFIPRGFDRTKPVELQYHFHGAFGNFIGMPVPYNTKLVKRGQYGKADQRLTHALTALSYQHQLGQRNTVLIYPLSAGRREQGEEFAFEFAYDDLWMKEGNDTKDNMTVLDFDVRNELQTKFGINLEEARITLSGHSAGGRAIMHAVESGFIPDKIKFLDATYNDWAQRTWQKCQGGGHQVPIEAYFKPGLITEGPANALQSKANVRVIAMPSLEHGQFLDLI